MVTKYGVISDTHQDSRIVPFALDRLKKAGIDKLIVNGDIGTGQDYIAQTLDHVAQSGLESFVQPGSHESLIDYEPVIDHFSGKHSNIINVIEEPKIEFGDHDLVFLPGSDFLIQGGQYQLANLGEDTSSDIYETNRGHIRLTNMNDLKKLVKDPEKTVVVCHIPMKFEDIETCVDMAYFAEKVDGSLMPGVIVENQIRQKIGKDVPYSAVEEVARQNGLTMKRENRGNTDLRDLYDELGITKSVTGHFHESVHRANNRLSQHVPEGEMVDSLFWNASYLDGMKAGVLSVDGEKVSYQNVDFNDYL
jgi:Icc-related predicted phosphoesterase